TLDKIQLGEITIEQAIKNGDVKLTGDKAVLEDFVGMLDTFNFWFNVVTP
ncbi:alkyl sulfatase C-terminal domain-containing protein, partial [Photobacterium damselae]